MHQQHSARPSEQHPRRRLSAQMSVRYGLRSSRVVCVDEWDRVLVQPAKVIIQDCHILAVIPEEGRSASAEEEELLRSCVVEDLGDAVIMPG